MRSLEMRYKEADIAIYCAPPLSICFYRIFSRASKGLFLRQKRLDCPEDSGNIVTMRLLKYMWEFEKQYGSMIEKLNQSYPKVQRFEARSNDDLMQIYQRLGEEV